MTLEFHPLANIFPLIEGAEFDALVADMKANGFRGGEEILLYEGKILDGRNRYRAAIAAGILSENGEDETGWFFTQFSSGGIDGLLTEAEVEAGPLAYVLAKNLLRRHLTESQRAMVAAKVATMRQGERTDLEPSANLPKVTDLQPSANLRKVDQAAAAKSLGVSERSVQSAKVVQEKGVPELAQAVERGTIAVSLAAKAANLPVQQQLDVVKEAALGRANVVRTVVKRAARAAKEEALAKKQRALPKKRYGVILADPEWRFQPYSRATGMDRAPDNHYPTSSIEDIKARPVASIAADDCVLFLWATAPMLLQALDVMAAWGFGYRTHAVWHKKREGAGRGPGYWFTGEHELLLVGVRGDIPAPAPGTQFASVFQSPVGAHSEKPDNFYWLIERYFPKLPKIELNARRARHGWDSWGLEAPETQAFEDAGKEPEKIIPQIIPEAITQPISQTMEMEIPDFLRRPLVT